MPTSQFYDPTGDLSSGWTESTGTATWNLLDEGVRQPNAPTTGSDRIASSTAGNVAEVTFPDTAISGTPTKAILWVHCASGSATKQSIDIKLETGSTGNNGTVRASANVTSTVAGWQSCTWDKGSPLTQAEVNSLTAVFVHNEPSTTTTTSVVNAAYIELVSPQVFTATSVLAATGAVASAATFFSIIQGALAIGATSAVASSATSFSVLEASATVNATATVVSLGEAVSVGPGVVERSVAVGASGGIASAGGFWSVLSAAGALGSTGEVASTGVRDLLRASALEASGAVASAGRRDLLRAADFAAAGSVVTVSLIEGPAVYTASALFAATSYFGNFGIQRELVRATAVDGVSSIATGYSHAAVHEASTGLTAVSALVVRVLLTEYWPTTTDAEWQRRWYPGWRPGWQSQTDSEWNASG